MHGGKCTKGEATDGCSGVFDGRMVWISRKKALVFFEIPNVLVRPWNEAT